MCVQHWCGRLLASTARLCNAVVKMLARTVALGFVIVLLRLQITMSTPSVTETLNCRYELKRMSTILAL